MTTTTTITTTDSAAYLAALPPAIQGELADLARTTVGMCDDEKVHALTAMVGCGEALFAHTITTGMSNLPLAFMDAASRVIKAIHEASVSGEVA
jgi:hypothetical protein